MNNNENNARVDQGNGQVKYNSVNTQQSTYQEGIMLWNNDETNWDSLCRNSSQDSDRNIINGLANFDQSAYTENAIVVER